MKIPPEVCRIIKFASPPLSACVVPYKAGGVNDGPVYNRAGDVT